MSMRNERVLRRAAPSKPASRVYRGCDGRIRPFRRHGDRGRASSAAPGLVTFAGARGDDSPEGVEVLGDRLARRRWTFRVLVLPGGRWSRPWPVSMVRHPNYVAVVGELVNGAACASALPAAAIGPSSACCFAGGSGEKQALHRLYS